MKRNKENKRPWTYRFMSVVLACAMLFTSSGFQTLAQEASTEIQTESAEEIAARQAAQQAQEAAAQQAAAEEAARQAEAQAQAAAAQQAAEEEAARQAEAQAQAAAAQQAAEEEAARQAAATTGCSAVTGKLCKLCGAGSCDCRQACFERRCSFHTGRRKSCKDFCSIWIRLRVHAGVCRYKIVCME